MSENESQIISDWLAGKLSIEQFEAKIVEHRAQLESAALDRSTAELASEVERLNRFRTRSKTHEAAFEKTAGWCYYCGEGLGEHLEHQWPSSRGGKTTPENCVVSCARCNTRKGQKTSDEFRIHLMLVDSRPPEGFFGEPPRPKRDWLIVASAKIDHHPPELHLDRLAAHLGVSP